jgi:hypothetical protein
MRALTDAQSRALLCFLIALDRARSADLARLAALLGVRERHPEAHLSAWILHARPRLAGLASKPAASVDYDHYRLRVETVRLSRGLGRLTAEGRVEVARLLGLDSAERLRWMAHALTIFGSLLTTEAAAIEGAWAEWGDRNLDEDANRCEVPDVA